MTNWANFSQLYLKHNANKNGLSKHFFQSALPLDRHLFDPKASKEYYYVYKAGYT